MNILDIIKNYLNENGYPPNWHVYFGGYDGLRVEWTAENGAKCHMDAWTLLNKIVRHELQQAHKEPPRLLESIILTHQQ